MYQYCFMQNLSVIHLSQFQVSKSLSHQKHFFAESQMLNITVQIKTQSKQPIAMWTFNRLCVQTVLHNPWTEHLRWRLIDTISLWYFMSLATCSCLFCFTCIVITMLSLKTHIHNPSPCHALIHAGCVCPFKHRDNPPILPVSSFLFLIRCYEEEVFIHLHTQPLSSCHVSPCHYVYRMIIRWPLPTISGSLITHWFSVPDASTSQKHHFESSTFPKWC